MKDFIGNELEVGDKVIFIAPNYRHYAKGIVQRFTKETVVIEYTNTWNYIKGSAMTIKQIPSQVIKAIEHVSNQS